MSRADLIYHTRLLLQEQGELADDMDDAGVLDWIRRQITDPVQTVAIKLPWPPSINSYWQTRVVKGKGNRHFPQVFIGEHGRRFRQQAIKAVWDQYGELDPLTGRLRVSIDYYPPDKRERDVDNHAKGVLDALTHAQVWVDDKQVKRLVLEERSIRPNGYCIVTIERIKDVQKELFK